MAAHMMASYSEDGARPPMVTFEERSEEDRAATIASGCYKAKSVDYVVIHIPPKDSLEKEALPWLENLPKNPNMRPAWVEHYKAMYRAFKEGQEPVPNGTHIRDWASINKAQAATIIAARILTVEDLATANESTLTLIGMGARDLQKKARDWLASANPDAEKMTALREKAAQQEQQIADMQKQLAALLNKQNAESPKPPADDFL